MWIKRWKGTISKDLHNENEHGEFLFSFLENVLIIFINLQCVNGCFGKKMHENTWNFCIRNSVQKIVNHTLIISQQMLLTFVWPFCGH